MHAPPMKKVMLLFTPSHYYIDIKEPILINCMAKFSKHRKWWVTSHEINPMEVFKLKYIHLRSSSVLFQILRAFKAPSPSLSKPHPLNSTTLFSRQKQMRQSLSKKNHINSDSNLSFSPILSSGTFTIKQWGKHDQTIIY